MRLKCLALIIGVAFVAFGCGEGAGVLKQDGGAGSNDTLEPGDTPGLDGSIKDGQSDTTPDGQAPPDGAEVGVEIPPTACDSDDDCDDDDDCTADACDAAGACQHTPRAGWCHLESGCVEAGEVNPEAPCQACLPAVDPGAWSADDTLSCGQDDACTGWACVAGACVTLPGPACDDGDPCTDDACEPDAGCVYTPNARPCDDGDLCTLADQCQAGVCAPGPLGRDCDDGDPCTDDSCNPDLGCRHFVNAALCDDHDVCTTNDVCSDGVCAGVPFQDCDDGNPCTDDWCDAAHGCLHAGNQSACDDGDPCTLGDQCIGAICVPGPEPLACDDANPCTDDACTAGVGCESVFNVLPCDDDDACTDGDACSGGLCLPGAPVTCDDALPCTLDHCDPEKGCVFEATTGPACDDALVCTADDACLDGACLGNVVNCDDGNDCTSEACVEPAGCVITLDESAGCGVDLTVTYPPRGVTLDSSQLDNGVLVVRGVVTSPADPSPSLLLNDEIVTLTPEPPANPPADDELNPGVSKTFTFAHPVQPAQGMTLLDFAASDALGQRATRVQSYYYSTVYYPMTEADFDTTRVPLGAAASLSQDFLDDDEEDLDDLASIVNLVISDLDLMSLFENPLTTFEQGALWTTCRYDVHAVSIDYTEVSTDIRVVSNGIHLTETLEGFEFVFYLEHKAGVWPCPGSMNGTGTADEVKIDARVVMSVVDGQIVGAVDDSQTGAEMVGLDVSVDSFFIDLLMVFLQGTIQSELETAVVDAIKTEVTPLLTELFDLLAFDLPVEIPAFFPGADPISVALQTRPSSVSFIEDTAMTIGMDAAVLTSKAVPHAPLGSIGYANCLASPFTGNDIDFGAIQAFNLGMFDDVLSQLLHAVWRAGAFELTLGPEVIPADDLATFGVSDLTVDLSAWLPPILTDCRDVATPEHPEAVAFELGDLEIKADLLMSGTPVALTVFASLKGSAAMGITETEAGDSQIGFSILGFDEVATDLVEVVSDDPAMGALIGELIETALVPMLLDQLSFDAPIGFELPAFDLGGGGGGIGIPEGTMLRILPNEISRTDNANTLVKGAVQLDQTQETP